MLVSKVLVLFFLCSLALILMVLTLQFHVDYSEVNKLDSRLTSEIRHPQQITHSRYLIRTNTISKYKCIAKIDGFSEINKAIAPAPCVYSPLELK